MYATDSKFSFQGIKLLPKRKQSPWNLCVFHICGTVSYKQLCVLSKANNACQCFTDLNAKGAILKAFEMYRLKSCVDFKPYEGESSYIIFQKLSGLV